MLPYKNRQTCLARLYQKYLGDLDTAGFIAQVSRAYRGPALHRLAIYGEVDDRRAAVMALGFLGNYSSNSTVASLLRDDDRGVRLLARESIHNVWMSVGTEWQRRRLLVARRFTAAERWEAAIDLASELCDSAPQFAEAWNELATANFERGNIERSLQNCIVTVKLNPYQYHALVVAGHCCLTLNRPTDALAWYHRALGIQPDLDRVRHEAHRLHRLLKRA